MKSRFAALSRNPRRTITGLAAALLAAGVAVGSGATFTSSTANPANTFVAGNLSHTNSKDGAAILSATKMKPGDTQTGTVVITNDGDVDGTFVLTQSNVTHAEVAPYTGRLDQKLTVKVDDITDAANPVNKVAAGTRFDSVASTALGTIAAGASKTYRFTVTFPDGGTPAGPLTGDNAFKKASAGAQFNWTATS